MSKLTKKQTDHSDSEESQILHLPKHVAIIMDGNGRWAQQRKKSRLAGHRAGAEAIRKVMRAAVEAKIEVLSLFAFSSENWRRPKKEVDHLMRQFLYALQNQVKHLHEHNIRLYVVGDMSRFSDKIQQHVAKAEALTKDNTGLKLVIAANYGGQWDILQATKKIAAACVEKNIVLDDINEALFENYLTLSGLPYPDLLIRTSGEQRISNFFLWQLAYAEFYFTNVLWPDFDENEFKKALDVYGHRVRRFGLTTEQAKKNV